MANTLLCGVDEAGYGPTLGPLVITGAAFDVPSPDVDLWSLLTQSVTRSASQHDRRLRVFDSKQLYKRTDGLKWLERTALTMMHVFGVPISTMRDMLRHFVPEFIAEMSQYPWYETFDLELPLENTRDQIAIQANAVRHDLARNNVTTIAMIARPILAGQFNRVVDQTRNKSRLSMGTVLQICYQLGQKCPRHDVCFCVDRQGGRSQYRDAISLSLDLPSVDIVSESDGESVYHCADEHRPITFAFMTGGESKHLPIALAGIVSKYIRELLMIGLNDYWSARVPGLKRTAGYYTDAHRFLEDIADARQANPVDDRLLVRSR